MSTAAPAWCHQCQTGAQYSAVACARAGLLFATTDETGEPIAVQKNLFVVFCK